MPTVPDGTDLGLVRTVLIRVHGGAGKIMGLVTVPPTALLLTFVLDKGTVTAAIEDVDTGLGTPNIRAVSKDLVKKLRKRKRSSLYTVRI